MSHQEKLNQIKEDLEEVQNIIKNCKSPRIKQVIQIHQNLLKNNLRKIEKTIENQQKKKIQKKEQEQQIQEKKQSKNNTLPIIYTPLTKYSWQDEKTKIKIYFTLQNISTQVTAQNVDIEFKSNSIQLKIRGYRKQNLIFSIKKLFGQIIPEQCHYLIKTNLLSITLTKKSTGTWTQLNFREDKFKTNDTKQDFSDPNASLMNMMKKMYQEGDQTMKKTIAQAWTKSRDKKPDDAFKFD